tara:strand:+ start:880 stop:1518 length:639 start_codon:yes stop_codon:yes gene_type:complete
MCFSAQASLTAYILGSFASIYLLIKGDKYDKHIGLFSLTFIQIQLAEFLMWIDQDCKNINHYASILADYILILQPLSIILGSILFKTTNIPTKLLYLFLLSFIIGIIVYSIRVIYNKRKLCSKSINNGYLKWDVIKKPSLLDYIGYFIFVTLIWLFVKNKKGLLVFIFTIISLLFGLNNNYKFTFAQWESKWCFFGVLLPFLIIIYNKFFIY